MPSAIFIALLSSVSADKLTVLPDESQYQGN